MAILYDGNMVSDELKKELSCFGGGGSSTGVFYYHVYNKDRTFDVKINNFDFNNNLGDIYKKFKRRKKLKKLDNL